MNKLKHIIFIFIVLLLVLPVLQKQFEIFKIRPLKGAYTNIKKSKLSTTSWINGSFQNNYNNYLEENIGFRNILVRINNQIDFSLFNQANANRIIVGKNHQMYDERYIDAYFGNDFLWDDFYLKKLRKLKCLQDTLKKLNVDLIVIYEPGKARIVNEAIPDRYFKIKKKKSSYEYIIEKSDSLNIDYIDFNTYFEKVNDTTSIPLYPEYGIHWNSYCVCLTADSLVRYIEKLRNIKLPDFVWDTIEYSGKLKNQDYDIGESMNLLWETDHLQMPYPVIKIQDVPDSLKPKVLIVADSYYFNILYERIPNKIFNNEFWYYNQTRFLNGVKQDTKVEDLKLQEEIENKDLILFMTTELTHYDFGWSFIENAYDVYFPEDKETEFYKTLRSILRNQNLMKIFYKEEKISKTGIKNKVSKHTEYLFQKKYKRNELEKSDFIKYVEISIRNSKEWLSKCEEKAVKRKISLEEMIHLDAVWTYEEHLRQK
ncbi:MAG: hypothetical protein JEY97_15205 [Bacteroidales bacterium]|nr:hypothetical protein [Bacteroidales bacterium]